MSTESAQQAPPRETRNVAIRLELHRQLKASAAIQGRTLQSVVEEAIQRAIDKIPNSLGDDSQSIARTGT